MNRNKFLGLMLVLTLAIIPILSAGNIANAATSGSMPSSLLANSVDFRLLSDSGTTPSVSGFSGIVRMVVTTTNGTSKLVSTAGLKAIEGYSSADWTDGATSLGFEGSQSAINSAIATLSFKGSTPGVPATVRLSAILGGPAYNPDNGHYYEVVSQGSTISWTDARAAAKTRTFNGLVGYLATITSAEEQAFLYSMTQARGWIGATDGFDISTDQIWKWADGPEANQTFWTTSCGTGLRGICDATGMYNFWNTGEPNNFLGPEESGEFARGSDGQWNDASNGIDQSQYLVEYGGGGGAVAETFDATTQITVAGNPSAPTGLTVTPGGGQLSLSFNEVSGANLNGGTLVRYEYQQDSGPWISLGTSSSVNLTGLTNDATYTYAVRTITTDGTEFISPASATVSAIPALAPTAPRNVTTKLIGTSVTVAWSAPTYDGGSPIVRYVAKVTPAVGDVLTCNTVPISGNLPLRTCVIPGLEVATAYTLTVTADNAALSSPDSLRIRFAVPQPAVTTSGSIPGKILRIPPTSFFGEIPTNVQQQLGNAGIVVPPSGAEQVRVLSNLSVSSIDSPSSTLVSAPVTSGSEINLQIVPPSDTPVGTVLRGTIELPDGTTIDIGNVTLDTNAINLGTGPTGFTIVPVGDYKVYFYLGESVEARARALADSGQIEVVYDLSVKSGPSGIPLWEDPATPAPTAPPTDESSPDPAPTETPVDPAPTETPIDPAPTETPVDPAPEVVLDARGLAVINPLEDAPLAVAQTAVSAIALAAGAAAAAAGAASAAGARSGGGSKGGRGSKSSSSSGGDSGSGDGATIEGIDFEIEDFSNGALNQGDKLKIWSLTAATALDKPSRNAAIKISQFSPLSAKLITDAAYLRAMFGTLAALLPAIGIALGLVGTIQAGGLVLPPSATVLMAIAVLGIFDALAGLIAVTIFTIGISLTAGISTAGDVRMMLGLFIIGFGPALLADAFRSLRRPAAQHHHHWWERVIDLAVAPFIGGWAVQGMVSALPSLAGVALPIADHADAIAIAAAGALVVRVLLEELVAHVFPGRLDFIHPTELPSSSNLQQVLAITLRSLIFCYVASAFVGTTWHLYVGTLIFAVPSYLGLLQDRLPNYPKLYHLLPAGLPGLAFTLVISACSLAVLISVFGETPDLAKVAFVLLPIPSTILGVIGMFGREAEADDVRWYQRESLTWLYRIGGVVMLVVTLRLAGMI